MGLSIYLVEPCSCGEEDKMVYYTTGFTHNLNTMAREAGIYKYLWGLEGSNDRATIDAQNIIQPLKECIDKMKADPAYYRKFDSPNGCGTYDNFLPELEKLLEACQLYPTAKIRMCP